MPTFSDLSRAAYCPRQLYYARRDDDRGPPPETEARQALAFRYDELRAADDETLADLPIDLSPADYRDALDRLSTRPDWEALCEPTEQDYYVEGKDCHGLLHKLLAGDPPVPTVVSPGTPPEQGVWEPQSVRLVAAAKALSWERERPVDRAFAEYPAYGVVRAVDVTARRSGQYRRALRVAESIDGPPARVDSDAKCEPCDYRERCGVKTRSLRSLL